MTTEYIEILENCQPAVLAGNFFMYFGSNGLDDYMREYIKYKSLPKDIKKQNSLNLVNVIEQIHNSLGISIDKFKRDIFLLNTQTIVIDRGLLYPTQDNYIKSDQIYVVFKSRKKGIKEKQTEATKSYTSIYFQKNALDNVVFEESDRLIVIVKDNTPYIGFTKNETASYVLSKVNNSYSSNLTETVQKLIVCGEYIIDIDKVYKNENQIYYKLILTNKYEKN